MGGKNQKTYTAPEHSNYAGPGGGQGTKMRPEMEKLISKSEKINSWDFYKNKDVHEAGRFHPDKSAASYRRGPRRNIIAEAGVTYNVGDIPKGLVDAFIAVNSHLEDKHKVFLSPHREKAAIREEVSGKHLRKRNKKKKN